MKKTLLVVDILKEFIYGDVKGENPEKIIPNLKRLLRTAREERIPVVYCKDSHLEQDPELKVWGEHAIRGSEGAEIVEEIKPKGRDYEIEKRTYNAFFQTGLESLLEELGAKSLYITGLYDVPCVKHTIAGAFFREYDITVIKDATQAFKSENHTEELKEMEKLYGAKLKDTQATIKDFRS